MLKSKLSSLFVLKLGVENMAVHYTILSTFAYVGKYFCKNRKQKTLSSVYLALSSYLPFLFHIPYSLFNAMVKKLFSN